MSEIGLICTTLSSFDNTKTVIDSPTEPSRPLTVDYTKFIERLASFKNWPNKYISIEALAKAGFYYKNHDDVVECPFCHIEGYHWVAGDNPMEDHRSWSPNCPFVTSAVETDNSSNSSSRDTCGLYENLEILPNSVPEDEKPIDLQKLGIRRNKGPTHPDKFSYDSRLKTFAEWPKSLKQTPHDLAEAGFFYIGVGDQAVCFHCGGGLKDWEASDDPWEQHALWFPKCSYLFLQKGQEYIDQIQQKKDPKLSLPSTSGAASSSEAKEQSTESRTVSKKVPEEEKPAEEKTLCKICFKNELGIVFLPCGHIVACVECSAALKNCAVCRKPLEATVRAFLS